MDGYVCMYVCCGRFKCMYVYIPKNKDVNIKNRRRGYCLVYCGRFKCMYRKGSTIKNVCTYECMYACIERIVQ